MWGNSQSAVAPAQRLPRPNTASWPVANRCLEVLSQLLLTPSENLRTGGIKAPGEGVAPRAGALLQRDLPHLLVLAQQHHVVVRALGVFLQEMAEAGNYAWAEWALDAINNERTRIQRALALLDVVVSTLEDAGCRVLVIKSLDHWPDLGSDLDLYTQAQSRDVIRVMTQRLRARRAPRSLGDRLAGKWGFKVPGLREIVEVHVGRLGQTGEHTSLGAGLEARGAVLSFGGYSFLVPGAEDRLLLTTLQRMYRHFYLRLCDVADTAQLLENEPPDFECLRRAAKAAGIWEGVASYLAIVSGYVGRYRGNILDLPNFVRSASRSTEEQLPFRRGFLRVSLAHDAAPLYSSEMKALLSQRKLRAAMRLGILPGLAAAAVLARGLTGSDKGIW